jgi:hypothetical protein
MERVLRRTFAALVLGIYFAAAAPTQDTTQACTAITEALPGKVLTPGLLALEYEHETQQYWSTTLRSVDPACIVQPVSAEDVSVVIKILNKYPTVNFATRSGGHDPNVGHASVQDGVLITMTDLVGATYDASRNLAYVKPGGEWNDVVGDLEPSGVTILGGRLGLDNPTIHWLGLYIDVYQESLALEAYFWVEACLSSLRRKVWLPTTLSAGRQWWPTAPSLMSMRQHDPI